MTIKEILTPKKFFNAESAARIIDKELDKLPEIPPPIPVPPKRRLKDLFRKKGGNKPI